MIQNVEELRPELHFEALGDALDGVVLEYGEIQVLQPRAGYDIAAGIAPQVETLRESAEGRIAIRRIEGSGRRRRDLEALGLNVVGGVPRIDERPAPRAGQAIRKGVIVGVADSLRVSARPPSWGKRRAVVRLKNSSHPPAVHYPRRRARDRFSNRKLPGGTNNQNPPDVEVRQAAGQPGIPPVQAADAIRELVARCGRRAVVNALAPSVRGLKLKPVAHSLRDSYQEGIVERVPPPRDLLDRTQVRVDFAPTPYR